MKVIVKDEKRLSKKLTLEIRRILRGYQFEREKDTNKQIVKNNNDDLLLKEFIA